MKFSEIAKNISTSYLCILLLVVFGGCLSALDRYSYLFNLFESIYYIFLSIVFADYVLRHIVIKKQRMFVFLSAVMIVLSSLIRTAKYKVFSENPTTLRFLWYTYYIPLICIPLFLCYTALCMGENRPNKSRSVIVVTAILSVLLIGLVLTNDAHQLVFRFESIYQWNNYTYSVFYFVIAGWIAALFFSAYIILIRKCHILMGKRYSWLVIAFGSIGWILSAVLTLTDVQSVLFAGNRPFKILELYCAQSVAFVLMCIRLWLIPADRDYDRLNRATAEVNEQLKEESELSRLQNELKREQIATNQKNQLYDTIAESVAEESEKILALTAQDGTLPVVCVYGAYIKRIANLMLMASEQPFVPMGELVLAVREIGKYLKNTKIFVSVQGTADGEIRTRDAIDILRILNRILCNNLSGLCGVAVTFSENPSAFLRVALEGHILWNGSTDIGTHIVCQSFAEDDVTFLTFGFEKDGDTP